MNVRDHFSADWITPYGPDAIARTGRHAGYSTISLLFFETIVRNMQPFTPQGQLIFSSAWVEVQVQ